MFDDFELSRRGAKPIHLFRFTRQGVVWRYAATDRDVTIGGYVWTAAPLVRSEIKQTVETAQASITITLPYNRNPNGTPPASQALGDNWYPYVPTDTIGVVCLATHLTDPDQQMIVEWMGQVSQPKFTDGQLELTCVQASSIGKAQKQGAKWQIACWKTPYSTGLRGCNLDRPAFTTSATLTAMSGLTLTAAEFGGLPLSLAGGALQFTDGNGIVQRLSIMGHTGTSITLLSGAAGLAVGTAVSVAPGCERTWAACTARGNTLNYGGAIYKPVQNPYNGAEHVMGLIKTLKRWRYIYGWRLRYWWLDTPSGKHARVLLMVLGFFGSIAEVVVWVIQSMQPVPAMHPHEAFNWFIAIVFGIGVAQLWDLAKGKPAKDQAENYQSPTNDDGQSVPHHFGTCWVDDSFLLAWKVVGREKIKASGGK